MSPRTVIVYTSTLLAGIGLGLGISGVGCNSYDLLVHDHFAQASFSNRVDILWLIDSSNSMAQDQENLQLSFSSFINELAAPTVNDEEEELVLESLTDAIGVYEQFLANRTQFLNYQMGVTTTQALPCAHDPTAFEGCEDANGTMGRLRSLGNIGQDISHPPTFLVPDTEELVLDFQNMVDVGIEGATQEFGLYLTAQVICGSLDMPFNSDFPGYDGTEAETIYQCTLDNWDEDHPWADFCACLPGQELYDYNINADGTRFLRDNSTLVVIIVSDEGDYTPNLGTNEWPWDISDCDIGEPWPGDVQEFCDGSPDALCPNYCRIDKFMDFFDTIDRRVVFAIVGPGAELITDQQGNTVMEVICNDQNSSTEMLEFYLWSAALTNGLYAPINIRDDDNICVDANFDETLADLGRLVSNLASGWHLSSVPSLETLLVFVEGDEIPTAQCMEDDEDCVPSAYHPSCTDEPSPGLNGWSYDESSQSIKFHGDCIPDYNQVVDIYYLPEAGGGRPLPF